MKTYTRILIIWIAFAMNQTVDDSALWVLGMLSLVFAGEAMRVAIDKYFPPQIFRVDFYFNETTVRYYTRNFRDAIRRLKLSDDSAIFEIDLNSLPGETRIDDQVIAVYEQLEQKDKAK